MSYKVLALKTEAGYEVLAWRKGTLSIREVRKFTKKFRHDADVLDALAVDWSRFFSSVNEMKKEVPEI